MMRKLEKDNALSKERRIDYCITALKAFYVGLLAGLALSGLLYCAVQTMSANSEEDKYVPIVFAASLYLLVAHITFHLGEFFVTMLTGRDEYANHGSFLLYHSCIYTTSTIMAWIEFVIEAFFVGDKWKIASGNVVYNNRISISSSSNKFNWVQTLMHYMFRLNMKSSLVFAVLTLMFYAVRLVAMVQCGKNFSLRVERERRKEHMLLETGLYKCLRHPAYFGWFWKVVFSQLILANPISLVVHTTLTWLFFSYVIQIEEAAMCRNDYFGNKYREYKKRTIIGIPFIGEANT